MTPGETIRARRKELNMTMRELARQAGISATMVHDIETGKKRPFGGKSLKNIGVVLKLDVIGLYLASLDEKYKLLSEKIKNGEIE